MRGGTIVGIVAIAVLIGATPVVAQTDDTVSATEIVLEPLDGARVVIGGREYTGTLTLTAHDGGISIVEQVDVDSYLLGIREVPFSWEPATLAAQAVAARTYLAWTLDRGRSSNGRRYDYDICATTACQVYAGVGGLEAWRVLRAEAPELAVVVSSGFPEEEALARFGDAVHFLQKPYPPERLLERLRRALEEV